MEENTTGNVDDGKRPDTRRWQEQDNSGHLIGSRQQGSSENITEELRKKEDEDNSELNKLDDRETVSGNETI
ncbi:MAG TPA: hypothetical protein VF623_15990 [Segetibacter sp.]|jgi:hypothetical protein